MSNDLIKNGEVSTMLLLGKLVKALSAVNSYEERMKSGFL